MGERSLSLLFRALVLLFRPLLVPQGGHQQGPSTGHPKSFEDVCDRMGGWVGVWRGWSTLIHDCQFSDPQAFLKKTKNNLRNAQTFFFLAFFFVDSGETDKTPKIINSKEIRV